MSKKYESVFALIQEDSEAKKYYDSLPTYVKDQINTRANNVNSLSSLQDYAENLLRGDD